MSDLLLGKPIALLIYNQIKAITDSLETKPRMALVLIGADSASAYYSESIRKQGAKVGIDVEFFKYENLDQKQFIELMQKLNKDPRIHAIMVQKPLPAHLSESLLADIINPLKDIDALSPINAGKMLLEKECFLPCTAEAVIEILKYYQINTSGKNIVVLGRSNVIGKPVANLLLRKGQPGDATVTICHSRTKEISNYTKKADIIIAAIGKANFLKEDMISPGCVIIDVGVNEIVTHEGKSIYVGDADFNACQSKAAQITPVPGGVGTVTTAVLLNNVIKSYKNFK